MEEVFPSVEGALPVPELSKKQILILGSLVGACLLLSAALLAVLVSRPQEEEKTPETEEPAHYQGMPLLVTRGQVEQMSYTDSVMGEITWEISDEQLEELNWVLWEYDISTPEEISQFLAQATVETRAGRNLTENGGEEYFQRYGYSSGTRGAGYLHLTFDYGQMAFSTWMMKKYVQGLEDIVYVNPTGHTRLEIQNAYYKAIQTAANLGLDVSEYSRIVYNGQDPEESGYITGADYIAERFAWESAAYFWHVTGISDTFSDMPGSENTDLASALVGGGNWQSRREAYAAFYPVFSIFPK